MLSSTITGGILVKYENAFAAIPLLVSFIPMLMDTGGNSGSQSSTMIIRGMAIGDVEPSDILKVVWKEVRVGVIVGFVLAVVNFIRLMIQYPGNTMICVTVVISLFCTVIVAKTIGCTLPIGAKVLKLDPAIMASPMITTIVDAVSLMVYFNLACHLLDMTVWKKECLSAELSADKYISTGDMDYGKNQNKICAEPDRPDACR